MSQEYEYEEPEGDLEEGNPEGEVFDPEAERERLRQEMQEKFDADKARFEEAERRRISDQLRNEAGIEWDPQSGFRPVDSLKVNQFAARAVGRPTEIDPLDLPIQPYIDDEDTIAAKLQRRDERLLAAAREEFRKELAPFQQMAQQPLISGTEQLARDALKQFMGEGAAVYTEHPEFGKRIQEAARQAVASGWAPAALNNLEAVATLALSCVPSLPKAEPARERDAGGRYSAPNASRAALSATRPSSGSGLPPRNAVEMDAEDTAIWNTCEEGGNAFSSKAEYEAFARSKREGDPDIYTRFREEQRRKTTAGRR
jgi:hypothetical protein